MTLAPSQAYKCRTGSRMPFLRDSEIEEEVDGKK